MGITLRETLDAAVTEVEKETDAPVIETPVEPVSSAPEGETDQQKSDRIRDEKGRFAAGEKPLEAKAAEAPQVAAQPEVKRPARPSSWKKDYWDQWEKLDPKVAEYINQREGEYAKGVSTYKQEFDNAKPLLDAVAPFLPTLQQNGIKPDQWISNLGRAHHALALGSGQEKLQMFAKLAQEYGIPLQALYDQNAAAQFSQQHFQRQPVQQPESIDKIIEQKLSERQNKAAVDQFIAEAPSKYPHFEVVRETMARLLDSEVAQDLPSAYDKALRMHDDLWQSEQESKRKADEANRLEAQRKATAQAKANAVSVKSATPASAGASAKKGLRAQLTEAVESVEGGRV